MRLWIFILLMALPVCGSALEKPQGTLNIKRQTQFYEVIGRVQSDLREELDRKGPLNEKLGKRFDGRTDWRVNWSNLKTDPEFAKRGLHRLTRWNIDLTVRVILPRWKNKNEGLPFLQRQWTVYQQKLQLHEAKHVQIAEAMAEALDRDFKSVAFSEVYPSQERLEAAIQKRADKIIRKYTQEHFLYDHRTRHGRTQGAHFP